jgi:hypothetical protein
MVYMVVHPKSSKEKAKLAQSQALLKLPEIELNDNFDGREVVCNES